MNGRGDSYIEIAREALDESLRAIDAAGTVGIPDDTVRSALGSQLGIAANGIMRALRDLDAHETRAGRRAQRDSLEGYLERIRYGHPDEDVAQFVHLVAPLPLEEGRLAPGDMTVEDFGRTVNNAAVAFSNENRDLAHWLMDAPTTLSWGFKDSYFYYSVYVPHGTMLMQELRIYTSGLIAYRRPIRGGWKERNVFPLDDFRFTLDGTLRFVERLNEDILSLRPPNLAVQSCLVDVGHYIMAVPGLLPATYLDMQPRELAQRHLLVPLEPRIIRGADLSSQRPQIVADFCSLLEGRFEPVTPG